MATNLPPIYTSKPSKAKRRIKRVGKRYTNCAVLPALHFSHQNPAYIMHTEFYTVEQAAEKLAVTVRTVRRHTASGALASYKRCGRTFIFADDLAAFVRSGKSGK